MPETPNNEIIKAALIRKIVDDLLHEIINTDEAKKALSALNESRESIKAAQDVMRRADEEGNKPPARNLEGLLPKEAELVSLTPYILLDVSRILQNLAAVGIHIPEDENFCMRSRVESADLVLTQE